MFMIWEHFKNRYLGQRAQGMVEYALILAFVAVIAGLVLTSDASGGLGGAIKTAINKVISQLGGTQLS